MFKHTENFLSKVVGKVWRCKFTTIQFDVSPKSLLIGTVYISTNCERPDYHVYKNEQHTFTVNSGESIKNKNNHYQKISRGNMMISYPHTIKIIPFVHGINSAGKEVLSFDDIIFPHIYPIVQHEFELVE